ncbi:T9SS type A sorting domain-containing protein, partial [Bacteroidales bacterium OttesenSCG-928-E04]|nr:T9SS type A sorting domain-containing protein [Bacteroidales bacterium OttesenSCG-928-E04]MDL2326085.1 T9SS type A sorting domain-containing protein [Bacteroidales bacterium OttesenSCG-928-A14]
MKKLILTIFVLSMSGFIVAQENIEDGGFEAKWEKFNVSDRPDFSEYWDYSHSDEDDLVRTLNLLAVIPPLPSLTTKLTTYREESDVHGGKYAIKLVSVKFNDDLFVPGAFGTISNTFIDDFLGTDEGEGEAGSIGVTVDFASTSIPKRLTGYYKYAPVKGDSAVIEIEFYNNGEKIASGKMLEYSNVGTWTKFDIPITPIVDTPATEIRMLFISSAGYNFDDLMTCKGQVGSALYIDDIAFNYESSLKENILSDVQVKTFPNPASETVTFTFNQIMQGNLVIYNILGAEIATYPIHNDRIDISVNNLESGTYLFR